MRAAPRSRRFPSPILSVPVLALAALLATLAVSCSGVTAPPAATAVQPADEAARQAVDRAREATLAEVRSLILLAREQARMGLVDDAEESWDQAIARLAPLATQDSALTGELREIDAERRESLARAAERASRYAAAATPDNEDERLGGLLDAPEPDLDPAHVQEVEGAAESVTPDYPVVVNDRVLAWLELYRADGKLGNWFRSSLERSGLYEARFREIFAGEGVPQDLIYLAHVESAFKTSAYSRARARGIFQFIAGTGRRYGLRVDWWVDERAEPEKSCRAAASYLRDLYDEFGDWYLALAAYNGGEGRVRRAIKRAKTKDFWTLSRRRFFRRETRNYVPAILAATLIAKDPARFGHVGLVKRPALEWEIVPVPDQADIEVLARAAGVSAETLRALNPALRRGQTPPKYPGYPLKVPPGHGEGFGEKLAQIPREKWIVKQLHRVRRGDTLSGLARSYGTSVRAIQLANGMGRRTLLSVGKVLEIPRGPVRGGYDGAPMRASGGRYTVRRGDTLGRIARRFHVSVARLQQWNGLGRSTTIYPGQRLKVSASGPPPATAPSGAARYTVRRGDTLGSIARRQGMSVAQLQDWNGLGGSTRIVAGQTLRVASREERAASVAAAPPASATSGAIRGDGRRLHVVRRGDTLWDLSRRYGVSVSELREANGLSRRAVLSLGQELVIPQPSSASSASAAVTVVAGDTVHVVRRGDSLYRIARQYGTTVQRLRRLNGLSRSAVIHPGDRLTIQ